MFRARAVAYVTAMVNIVLPLGTLRRIASVNHEQHASDRQGANSLETENEGSGIPWG
jgi:hypothetical protein